MFVDEEQTMRVIGLDIGGANLKASDGEGRSDSQPFAMWERAGELGGVLRTVLASFGSFDAVALTMTGELADCFKTKAGGVGHILDAAQGAAGPPVHVWQTSGEFVAPEVAQEFSMLTAAANWHALATWAARMAPGGAALLIDVGSTTSDIIPLQDGMPTPTGRTDLERLLSGELAYTGVRRTPVCAVAQTLPVGETRCPVAAELFATMEDAYLILGDVAEDERRCDTADGGPATRAAALRRLARMICCDLTELTEPQLVHVAGFLGQCQTGQLAAAITRVTRSREAAPQTVLLSGEGEFLARRAMSAWRASFENGFSGELLSLSDSLGPVHSQAACAYALARLGRERIR